MCVFRKKGKDMEINNHKWSMTIDNYTKMSLKDHFISVVVEAAESETYEGEDLGAAAMPVLVDLPGCKLSVWHFCRSNGCGEALECSLRSK
jgi:hypothetical protein